MDTLIAMLENWRELHQLSKVQVAQLLGAKSSQVYTNWVGRQSIPKEYMAAAMLIVQSDSVLAARLALRRNAAHGITGLGISGGNVRPGPAITGEVPLISWVQAGAWSEAMDDFAPGDCEDFIACATPHSPHTFALRVTGDSMTSPSGKSYPSGCVIFVDPEQRGGVVPGDRVIARLNGDNAVTFKQLAADREGHYLKALNPNEPDIYGAFTILGKVIGKWEDER